MDTQSKRRIEEADKQVEVIEAALWKILDICHTENGRSAIRNRLHNLGPLKEFLHSELSMKVD